MSAHPGTNVEAFLPLLPVSLEKSETPKGARGVDVCVFWSCWSKLVQLETVQEFVRGV